MSHGIVSPGVGSQLAVSGTQPVSHGVVLTESASAVGASNSGISRVGLNGTAGAGSSRGIIGVGLNGITGVGLNGITGVGLNGITGVGLNGITGVGLNGITGVGVRGITGVGVRGITGVGSSALAVSRFTP
jgi:hypothetical protein